MTLNEWQLQNNLSELLKSKINNSNLTVSASFDNQLNDVELNSNDFDSDNSKINDLQDEDSDIINYELNNDYKVFHEQGELNCLLNEDLNLIL